MPTPSPTMNCCVFVTAVFLLLRRPLWNSMTLVVLLVSKTLSAVIVPLSNTRVPWRTSSRPSPLEFVTIKDPPKTWRRLPKEPRPTNAFPATTKPPALIVRVWLVPERPTDKSSWLFHTEPFPVTNTLLLPPPEPNWPWPLITRPLLLITRLFLMLRGPPRVKKPPPMFQTDPTPVT